MKIKIRGILILILATSHLAFAQPKQESSLSFLRTSGQDIVNESGAKVFLKGVGLGNWLLPEGYMWKFGGLGDRPRKIEKVVADLIGNEEAAKFWKAFRQNCF
jgi:endoglucanase